jgi:guanosine-3',5'-bis(diphosphate) 3'-pyrophosphohydrolase
LRFPIRDTETAEEELRTTFGEEIAQIVVEMTDDKSLPKEQRKRFAGEPSVGVEP